MGEQRRTALVTGASSGVGRETAKNLAASGFNVIAAARRMIWKIVVSLASRAVARTSLTAATIGGEIV